ncbi:ATPase, T2SS/T4P/T4SS family [Natronoglomus mannanivorans]|uniref:ATPase, T2SS/T4P/T4SS family n=1 Tax=Natronoglomus mannanivorans TaxID=2979990 RepID=A0AAP3E0I0_9EURY|nr:ATPase, T2SS/T4P/T4SS family [Halobacteria archaeon AArc-xg1-1]
MAIDEADQSDAGHFSDAESSPTSDETRSPEPTQGSDVRVGDYTWADFMNEYGYGDEVSTLYPQETQTPDDQLGLDTSEDVQPTVPSGQDWDRVSFDPTSYLGYDPDELSSLIESTFAPNANVLQDAFLEYVDPETTPVTKDVYTWEHYKWEYYYDEEGNRPRDGDGAIDRFDEEEALGFDPAEIHQKLHQGGNAAMELDEVFDERTVNVNEECDEDDFFSTVDGHTTVANRYDLEKTVPQAKKSHFREEERYWVNKPYAFVIIFHSEKENEKKYYLVEPYLTEIETELQEFLSGKLRTAIKYSDDGIEQKADEDGRRTVIENETRRLLKRYDLFEKTSSGTELGIVESLRALLNEDDTDEDDDGPTQLEGIEVRPEPVLLAEDGDTINEYQVEKLLYLLKRNFIGYERIDGIKHDINVEDISVDGYNSPVFVYHSEYEQIISNVFHGEDELDDFVVKLAQRSGKGISKRLPQVDATLPDGSRAQLTLGREVSDHGTNYTIRQFKDVPFTPVDLINWNTFSLDEMAFLWLAIENHKSLIFAGGTASGKTTSLNAVSLFIPSNSKIVSIEDTREVELPQRNWIASITRPSFSDDSQGDVDEFDLLEAALRQRPDYIVMGEIRGEEGRTLFQVMSTGHTTYTTFHADSVDEVLKRFTTDPINVSKTMFTALDLVSIQTQTRVQGRKVRRNKSLTEINHYEAEHDEINVQDVYQWQAETDEYLKMGDSNTLEEIQFDRGWSHEKLQNELFKREIILAYLIKNGLNTYAQVAATAQAFINDPDTILTLIANGQLEDSLEDLREMESVLIDVDPEKEELVPRPDASSETYNLSMDILERAEESLFEEYRGKVPSGLADALGEVDQANTISVDSADTDDFDFGGEVDESVEDGEWDLGDGAEEFSFADEESTGEPSWLDDDDGFTLDEDADGADGVAAEADAETGTDTPTADTEPEPTTPDRPELEAASPEALERDDTPTPESTGSTTSDVSGTDAETDSSTPPELEANSSENIESSGETEPLQLDGDLGGTDESTPVGASESEPERTETSEFGSGQPKNASGGGFDGLFSDMDRALQDVDSDSEPASTSGPAADSETETTRTEDQSDIDTDEFDSMFPDRDLSSIFGSDASSGDASGFDQGQNRRGRGRGQENGQGRSPFEESAADEGSIFGDESGSIFSDDDTDGDGETDGDRSIFSTSGNESMFEPDDGAGENGNGNENENGQTESDNSDTDTDTDTSGEEDDT